MLIEVKTYDPSGDSTPPTCSKKCKIEQVDKEDEITEKRAKKVKIKVKVEEEEEEKVAEETSVKKKKKKSKKKDIRKNHFHCVVPAQQFLVQRKRKKKERDNEN